MKNCHPMITTEPSDAINSNERSGDLIPAELLRTTKKYKPKGGHAHAFERRRGGSQRLPESQKRKGNKGPFIGKEVPLFCDFVDSTKLHDLGFRGPAFTWHQGNLFERLDRALGNEAWLKNFPNRLITHLLNIKSDYKPIFLNLKLQLTLSRGRPFQFLVGWTKHLDFGKFVNDRWDVRGSMSESLALFTNDLKDWNKFVYGHITTHKRNLIHKLSTIQKKMEI
ncbi:hypothetical protein J1N35_035994 [Gossypium stocksii]|uniref:Uncharacterized protein n=1 Tax=Gossypium stocksii TaxID=47602 RepID=A0A9D3UVQ7_9ROSI|nr:hypothetical protein J1N35_035994 [Gossypium stocksii]